MQCTKLPRLTRLYSLHLPGTTTASQVRVLLCARAGIEARLSGRVADADAVYRTDVFPGLGWMITLEIWREIGGKWPQNYWDEWMRLPEVSRRLQRPHVIRVISHAPAGEQGPQCAATRNLPHAHVRGARQQRGPVLQRVLVENRAEQPCDGVARG